MWGYEFSLLICFMFGHDQRWNNNPGRGWDGEYVYSCPRCGYKRQYRWDNVLEKISYGYPERYRDLVNKGTWWSRFGLLRNRVEQQNILINKENELLPLPQEKFEWPDFSE